MAHLAGDRPETGGALWDGTRKAWPLLCSASSHQWECNPNPTPAATRAHRGGMGVS